jgi:hypothetical protein
MKRLIHILILSSMSTTSFSQAWIDTNLYPFENKYLQLETGNMHYVDEVKERSSCLYMELQPGRFCIEILLKNCQKLTDASP